MALAEIDNNETETYNFIIDKSSVGARIDKFLSNHLESITRSQIQNIFETGKVRVNGRIATKSYKLKIADSILIDQTCFDITRHNLVLKKNDTNRTVTHEIHNEELRKIKVHLESIEKQLSETSYKLLESERKLSVEKKENISLNRDNTELIQTVATLKNESTELSNAQQTIVDLNNTLKSKEREIQKLQSEENKKNNLLKEERTKKIGKFDEWNRKKFEILQANTQQQFVEYHKMLANYQNELDRFRGKKPEEKTISEESKNEYIIPEDEKAFSEEDYDAWSQEKFDKLAESTQRQFYEYELLLERYNKQLDKYKNFGKDESQSQIETENDTNKKNKGGSIKDEIIDVITAFWKDFKTFIEKENPEPYSKIQHQRIKLSKPKRIFIIISEILLFSSVFILALVVIYYQIIK